MKKVISFVVFLGALTTIILVSVNLGYKHNRLMKYSTDQNDADMNQDKLRAINCKGLIFRRNHSFLKHFCTWLQEYNDQDNHTSTSSNRTYRRKEFNDSEKSQVMKISDSMKPSSSDIKIGNAAYSLETEISNRKNIAENSDNITVPPTTVSANVNPAANVPTPSNFRDAYANESYNKELLRTLSSMDIWHRKRRFDVTGVG